ncbi:conserved hypothetical protein [Leishmania infantum JPCM5]|uniref:N-terminal_region_of_Chorein_-_a_TM_vesicle-mediated_sorter_-_putative n=2 Tax=Leishmania infantum TaxID=5671 RepID=A0A6L0WQT2_LEIIN|nr:conserved hypothetical protein [Leishmania infantum JPCM5]CAC9449945.1 N-terminal_region_of_Chorein_-_a_TM_vesicle-mediated_sorter_-_putative [Leishmania infantum]CAM65690.2 conserved hypothetical protein [Leishmania infantum JPCM5]SUZ39314.1 N-terminal_region_of_Chorein_-_a_TM_vesicle-mediated_sorter_-_putative [Leishmania infantum]|eukprot:XP_001463332.2 conserved hypothetical protein [Leishmania infantum JPCM5]
MQQMVVTYVLSGLANIADVNPRDVHTSLFNGNVRVNNLSLRPETMNKILPLPIEEGTVPEMELQVPNPSTANAMEVKVHRGRLLLPLDLSSPPLDRTPEQILRGVTDHSILGSAAAVSADTSSEPVSPASEPEPASYDYSCANSDMDEEDFASCASDGDLSDCDSTCCGSGFGSPTSADETQAAEVAKQDAGWLDYLRSRAARSVEWIWRRQLRITFTDLTLTLPCDARKKIHFEISVDSFVVTIEPAQTSGREQMKIVSMEIGGVSVFASADDVRSCVIVVEALSIKITTVYETGTERVLRKNVALSFNGTSTLTADEVTLLALLKCHLSRQMRLSVPAYCLPYSSLRARGSLWPYVKCCVVQGLRDYRQRYNFNASHLRFYAHARERYMQLLNECHRNQSVEDRRQALADAEQDLRYEDVILYFRRLVQAKYAANAAAPVAEEVPELESAVVSSTHFEWKLVKVVLPARNTVFARNTALVFRNGETVFTIASVSLDADGAVQTMIASTTSTVAPWELRNSALNEETALIYLHTKEDYVSSETKVILQQIALKGSMEGVLCCLMPIAEALQQIGEQEKCGATTQVVLPGPLSIPPAARVVRPSTTIVAVHSVSVQLDDFCFLLDRLSATSAKAPGTPGKLGCTLRQSYLRHKTTYVLAPLEVRMTARGGVVVSRVALEVPRETWTVWRRDADSLRLLFQKLPRLANAGVAHATAAPAPSSPNTNLDALKAMTKVLQWPPVSSCPPFEVEEVAVNFSPLDCTIALHQVAAQTVSPSPSRSYGTHFTLRHASVECHYTGRLGLYIELKDGMRVGMSTEPAAALAMSIPSIRITGRRDKEAAEVSLLEIRRFEVVVHNTVQYASMSGVSLAGSVQLADVDLIYKTDPSVVPLADRPCLTSYVQVAVEVNAIDLGQLCAVPSHTVACVLGEIYRFACAEIVSEEYYRTFFSCFSDVALQVVMRECVVRCGAAGGHPTPGRELLLSMSNTASEGRVAALDVYQPHLFATPDSFPILILNDVGRLSMDVDVSQLTVLLSAPVATSPSSVAVIVSVMHWRMPLEKMPFWCAEAQEIPSVPQQITLEAVRVIARLDHTDADLQPALEASLSGLTAETVSGTGAAAADLPGLPISRDLQLSPSESDRGSCASSTEEQWETTQVSLRRWSVDVDLSAPVSDFGKLQHMISAVASAQQCLARRVVLRESVAATNFDLDDCGDVFLDAPTQILVVESCLFRASSSDRHVVVCPGTSAVFRRCVFPNRGGGDLIRVSSRSALFLCEDCCVEGEAAPMAMASAAPATAPTVPSPRSSAADAGVRPRRRTHVTVEEGCVAIGLDASSRVVLTQRALALTHKQKTRRSFFKLRNGEVRIEYADAEQRVPVLTKTSLEGDFAVYLPNRSCSASCSVTCGEVTIPLLFSKVHAAQERLELLTSFSRAEAADASGRTAASADDLSAATYVVPPPPSASPEKQQRFPYDSWKLLLSLSLIPLTVRFLGGMTVARVTFSNAFVWSKREPFAEAQLEARIAVHDMALWEWPQQSFQSVVTSPVFVGVQGRMPTPLSASVTASVSPVQAAVSTDQVKLMLHALSSNATAAVSARPATAPAQTESISPQGLCWYNYTGVALQARGGHGAIVRVPARPRGAGDAPSQVSEATNAVAPLIVTEIDGTAVDYVERDVVEKERSGTGSAPGYLTPLFVSRKTVVLADKRRFHVTSTLKRDLVHAISVRTLVQIENETPLPLVLTAGGQSACIVEPFTLSCVPEAMMHRTDISVAVTLTKAGAATLREPLLPKSIPAMDFYQCCHQQGRPPADMAREFVSQLDGSSTFMVTMFELQGPVLLLRFRGARPHVVNDTVYPLRVTAVNTLGEMLASEYVLAGERAYFLNLPPTGAVHGDVHLCVDDDEYEAHVEEALFDRETARMNSSVLMTHQAHPRRYFFHFSLSVESRGPAGEYGVAVTAGCHCLVKNCTTMDLFFFTGEGNSVGTMGTRGLPGSTASGAIGYVPSNVVLRIKPKGAALSEAFEIDRSGEGCVIQCDHAPEASAFSALYFLLRTVSASPAHRLAELLPAVVFRNRHARYTLLVKHVVREAGAVKPLEETVFEVPPHSDCCYYTLSKYGYTNDLLFAWCSGSGGCAAASSRFSSVVETDLAPGTTWSGFVCVGATHHQIDIAKGSLYETAYVTVGPAVLPRVKLVNFTSISFRDVGCYQVAFPRPSKNNKYLLLTSADGAVYTVDLLQEEPLELDAGVTVQTIRGEGDRCCVVLSSRWVFTTKGKTWAEEVQISVNVQTNGVSLRLRDANTDPLHLCWRSLAANVMWTQMISVQCSVTGICLESHYEGRKQQVAEPFDADVSLREMRRTSRDVYLKGFYLGLQQLTITVSEVLLYQLQMVASRCRVDMVFDPLAWVQEPTAVALLRSVPVTLPQHLHIGSASIAETPLELSWDRSTLPPHDFLLGDSAISKLIPSLHHAMLVLPKLQLRNVSRVSLAQLIGRVRQILIMEVVKQIPKMVTTVGFFKKNSSLLEKVTSTVSSFLFRTSDQTDTTDDGGSALI